MHPIKVCRTCNANPATVKCDKCDQLLYCCIKCKQSDPEPHNITEDVTNLTDKLDFYQQLIINTVTSKKQFLIDHINKLDEFHYYYMHFNKDLHCTVVLGASKFLIPPPVALYPGKFIYCLALFAEIQFRGHIFVHGDQVGFRGSTCDTNIEVINKTIKTIENR